MSSKGLGGVSQGLDKGLGDALLDAIDLAGEEPADLSGQGRRMLPQAPMVLGLPANSLRWQGTSLLPGPWRCYAWDCVHGLGSLWVPPESAGSE